MQSFKDSGIYELLFKKNDPSNSIIDPLTCVVRLSLLKYKPDGTKISVKENQISYNEPTLLQGPIRWTFGDCRDDLHNLFNPHLQEKANNPTFLFLQKQHFFIPNYIEINF